jgi:hypothetical protein
MRVAVFIFSLLLASSAFAQQAVVTSTAPIFVRPGAIEPLRTAAVGTVLRVVGQEGDWIQVQFKDPRWGLRTGWVQATLLDISRAETTPMDLSVTAPKPVEPFPVPPLPVRSQPAPPREAPRAGLPHVREGFWFNIGLGFGSLGCQDCATREDGLSGGLSLGGAIGDRVLLGVGTSGWAKNVAGQTLSVGVLDARVRFYPVRTSGFFLTGGLGVGSISFAGESEFGAGAIVGLGWDIRVSRNVSLTPFWNGFAMSNSNGDANVGQIGVGVTIH